jgi:hypothetical protein
MLTTVDNPYDPFTEYSQWYAFDTRHSHHSCSLLARIINTSPEMSDADQAKATEDAIDEIVFENVSGMYRKVVREVEEEFIPLD